MQPLSVITGSTLLLASLILSSCGGPATTDLAPRPTKDVIKASPDWFLEPPTDSEHLFATASATSRDMQLALQKARTTAQTQLAQMLGTRLANLSRQFHEEVGMAEDSEFLTEFNSATKAVTDETLVGATVDRQELVAEKRLYRAYVLMSLPIGAANQLLMDKIRANQNLHTRLRATQAFGDLDRELEALETHGPQ